MNQEDINELHQLIEKWTIDHKYNTTHLLTFLTITLVGTMAMKGYSQEFFYKTADRMKIAFKEMQKKFKVGEK